MNEREPIDFAAKYAQRQDQVARETRNNLEAQRLHSYWNENGDPLAVAPVVETTKQFDAYVAAREQWDVVWENPTPYGTLDLLYDPNI